MANWSDLYTVVKTSKELVPDDGAFIIERSEPYTTKVMSVNDIVQNDGIAIIYGEGRWYFGTDAVLQVDGVESIVEYIELEAGCNYFNYWKDGEEISEEYMCINMIKYNEVDTVLDWYEGVFQTKAKADKLIDMINIVDKSYVKDDRKELYKILLEEKNKDNEGTTKDIRKT